MQMAYEQIFELMTYFKHLLQNLMYYFCLKTQRPSVLEGVFRFFT